MSYEEKSKKNIKKINNIISDNISKDDNKDFDVLFLVDATGSMGSYIISAKEETKNIAEELRKLHPEMNFKYGYIFYRDPIDSPSDKHEVIDLTDNVNSLPIQIEKIKPEGGGDRPEDWVGAYKLVNEKISWRNGKKAIMHLADAGAHGKLFTLSDKYPEEEAKLIQELEKCASKNINIFGYVIKEDARNSFNECSKIYRSKGGSFEVLDFCSPEMVMEMNKNMAHSKPFGMNPMMKRESEFSPMMNPMMGMMNSSSMMGMMNCSPMMGMMNMNSAPMMMNSSSMSMQMMNNMNFNNNAMNAINSMFK